MSTRSVKKRIDELKFTVERGIALLQHVIVLIPNPDLEDKVLMQRLSWLEYLIEKMTCIQCTLIELEGEDRAIARMGISAVEACFKAQQNFAQTILDEGPCSSHLVDTSIELAYELYEKENF